MTNENAERVYSLNPLGEHLKKQERAGITLYVWETGGRYHLPGERYDDILKSLCGKASGRLGHYGVTDSILGMKLCADCAALESG
jgi:hypothetical protein